MTKVEMLKKEWLDAHELAELANDDWVAADAAWITYSGAFIDSDATELAGEVAAELTEYAAFMAVGAFIAATTFTVTKCTVAAGAFIANLLAI